MVALRVASRGWGRMVLATRGAPAAANSRRLVTSAEQAQAPQVQKKARPMPDPAELRRQILAYKQQVHELRLQYAKELEAKANKTDERKKAAASVSARGDATLAKDRAEHAEMKKKRMQERAMEQEKMNARRMQAGQLSFKGAAEKRERQYLSQFGTLALEAKTWSASADAAESLIQDALVDEKRPTPQWRMPQRSYDKRAT